MTLPTPPTIEDPLEPSDPRRLVVQVGPGAVTYTDEGQGPALLLVHGLPGSARDWRHLSPRLEGVRRIRVDLPGFGGTSRLGRRAWTVAQRARLLADLLDVLRLDRVVVAGHSMGGPIATALAGLAPGRVAGLALLASPGLTPHRLFVRSRVVRLSRLLRVPGLGRVLAPPLRWGFVRAGFPRSTSTGEMISSAVDAGMLDFADHAARLRALRLPTLVAWAEDDRLVEAAIGETMAEILPPGPRLVWPTGGHNIQKTRADELGPALAGFTRRALGVADTPEP